jgi:hypothetical protein
MKKILLVSGCSYTDKNYQSIYHPEIDCSWPKWPELLAEKLNMECINLGKGGSGQEYIYNSILDYSLKIKKEDIGLIIPAWSGASRRDYQSYKRWHNILWDTKGDMPYFIQRSLRYFYSFQIFCERFNLPYKQVQMISLYSIPHNTEHDKNNILAAKHTVALSNYFVNVINHKNFIGWPPILDPGFSMRDMFNGPDEEKYLISKKDRHPNEEGQKLIAKTIYENL